MIVLALLHRTGQSALMSAEINEVSTTRSLAWGVLVVGDAESRDIPSLEPLKTITATDSTVVIRVRHAQDGPISMTPSSWWTCESRQTQGMVVVSRQSLQCRPVDCPWAMRLLPTLSIFGPAGGGCASRSNRTMYPRE